jgi:hypothetical protein
MNSMKDKSIYLLVLHNPLKSTLVLTFFFPQAVVVRRPVVVRRAPVVVQPTYHAPVYHAPGWHAPPGYYRQY